MKAIDLGERIIQDMKTKMPCLRIQFLLYALIIIGTLFVCVNCKKLSDIKSNFHLSGLG